MSFKILNKHQNVFKIINAIYKSSKDDVVVKNFKNEYNKIKLKSRPTSFTRDGLVK